ncbi:MAG: hypothetical protein AABY34_05610 [Pseudomonadota bacterium]
MKKIFFILLISLFISTVYADEHELCLTQALLPDLINQMQQAKSKINMTFVFPQKISCRNKIYFSDIDINRNGYTINIDSTKTCHGTKVCHVGHLQAEQSAYPSIYYDRQDNAITWPVHLKNQVLGYFTPSHAMGDFWPAQLQWRQNFVLYTLSWNLEALNAKKNLIEMANSMIV